MFASGLPSACATLYTAGWRETCRSVFPKSSVFHPGGRNLLSLGMDLAHESGNV